MKKNKIINLQERINKESNKPMGTVERNKIIMEYMPMIRCIARKISSKLPAHIDHEDLVSNGVIGLMDAIQKYDSSRNNTFKTYAEFRVRGSILDSLRSQDWIPRSVRDKSKRIQKVTKDLEQRLSRAPKEKEVADALGVSMGQYHELVRETRKVNIVSIDESSVLKRNDKASIFKILENESSSFQEMNKKSIQRIITQSIEKLHERERIVLSLYYYEEYNLRKIGQILKITESRVSQLHSQAIEKLKAKLMSAINEEELKAS